MLLRNGKRTRKEIPIILPLEIQKTIFSQIDLYLFCKNDRSLQKYLINNTLYNDPEAILCWAIGQKDKWLIKRVLQTGHLPEVYSREIAVLHNVTLDSLLKPIDTDSTRRFYLKNHLRRGEISKALEYYNIEMTDVRDDAYIGMQDAVAKSDPGILRALDIWPDLRHCIVSYSCMYGKTDLLRELHDNNMLQHYFGSQYFVSWAIQSNHIETVKYLLEIGFSFDLYDHKEIGSIFQNTSSDMLEFVFHQVKIPDDCLKQGLISAAEGGRLPIIRFLNHNEVDCREPSIAYRSIAKNNVDTYYYLRQLS